MKLVTDAIKGVLSVQVDTTAAFRKIISAWAKRKGRAIAYYDVMGIQWFELVFCGKEISVYQTSFIRTDDDSEVYYRDMRERAFRFLKPLVDLLEAFPDLEEYGLDFGGNIAYDENGVEGYTEDRSDKTHGPPCL